ncbi:MAG: hypothetical protein HY691_01540 [Chloroflexi bacterium]|nr:hypothetical protein [Chloroflexota bacterium]
MSPLLRVTVLGVLLALAVLPALARLPVEAAALRAWQAAEPRAIAAALEARPPRPVYVTTNWIPWLDVFLGFPGLAPGDRRRALQRLRFGDLGRPVPVPDAYVVHDRGVIANRPLAWREIATPTARSVVYLAPADAPPPCAEGMSPPPSPLSARGERERGGEVASCAGPEAYVMDVEAELFRGLAPPDSAAPIGAGGWTSYAQGFYSAGGAAITRLPGAPIWQNVWQLPPGEYRIALRVYDQGNGGRNVLAVRLNHTVGVARWQSEQPGVREVNVAIADPDGGNLLALTPLFVGQGTLIVDRVSIARSPATWQPPIDGPLALEAEDADGLALAPGGDYSRADGWTSYAMPFYSGGRAAITRAVGRTITLPLPALAAGDYEVTVTVYDYGNGGENVLEIALNGVVADLRWGGDAAGVRDLHLTLRGVGAGSDLRLRALRNGQGYVIVDRVMLVPATP